MNYSHTNLWPCNGNSFEKFEIASIDRDDLLDVTKKLLNGMN